MPKRLTRKELEILQRQRAVAVTMQAQRNRDQNGDRSGGGTTGTSAAPTKKPRPPPPPPSIRPKSTSRGHTSLSELLGGPPRTRRPAPAVPKPPPPVVPKPKKRGEFSGGPGGGTKSSQQSSVGGGGNGGGGVLIDLTRSDDDDDGNDDDDSVQEIKMTKSIATSSKSTSTGLRLTKQNNKKPLPPKPKPAPPASASAPALKRPTKRSSSSHAEQKKKHLNSIIESSRSRLKESTTATMATSSTTTSVSSSMARSIMAEQRAKQKIATSSSSSAVTSSGSTSGIGGRLSSLLNQAGVSKATLTSSKGAAGGKASWEEEEDRNGSALDMDDYYNNLRQWDFLRDWDLERSGGSGGGGNNGNKKRGKGNGKNSGGGEDEKEESSGTTMLPDKFTSRRQYQKSWAPLCLAETRAQILSDASGNLPWRKRSNGSNSSGNGNGGGRRGGKNNNNNTGPAPITVKASAKDASSSSSSNMDAMTVITSPRNSDDMGPSFMSGDVVLLAHDKSTIVKASRGELFHGKGGGQGRSSGGNGRDGTTTSTTLRRLGIVGHVEYARRTTDGLKIKVSRRLWIQIYKGEKAQGDNMFILNLGGNVTSLREFTALCRVNQLPLLSYVLGRKMTRAKDNLDDLSDALCLNASPPKGSGSQHASSVSKSKKEEHLKNMGGKAALGEGFMKYARRKFNSSQLGAISAAASEYGEGGFTLIKGPPGTGKTTTLCALLNALHIRQFNQYYDTVRSIVDVKNAKTSGATKLALAEASKKKPRMLVCAPSNNAIDNVIEKIMESGFIDGSGRRYNPSIVRIGVGQSDSVKNVSLETKVDHLLSELEDAGKVQGAVAGYKSELSRIQGEIQLHRRKLMTILKASEYPLAMEWEIRIDENCQPFYVNHLEKRTTYECPPPPEPGETHRPSHSMPEFKLFNSQLVKLVDRFTNINSRLERYSTMSKRPDSLRDHLETNILDTTHIVLTTLGTSGCRALENCAKFEVVVVDEAAQSVEPATLVALQLGSSHAILVGDPNQLPATIFSVSGRTTKYDRSLFQRLEEAGHEVHLLDTQYRMHPQISKFPRNIFYGGLLKDGPNVMAKTYGNPLRDRVTLKLPNIHPFTVFDLDSSEERGGSSLSNSTEARFALQLYENLTKEFGIFVSTSKVAIITPYAQQASLLRQTFAQALGNEYHQAVEVNTVDSFQGREANIVIFSCVRAAGSKGIGFLSDVRRMNVALTRAKHFLFVIARCESISVNPYWDQLVKHARKSRSVVSVPRSFVGSAGRLSSLEVEILADDNEKPTKRRRIEEGEV